MDNIIFGINTCNQYLEDSKEIKKIYLSKTLKNRKIIDKCKRNFSKKIEFVDNKILDKMSNGANHQGILMEIESFKYYDLEDILCGDNRLIVMLDGITDPHNLGAILRTCDACGVDGVVIGKNRSVSLNSTVAKVSTGAIDSVKVCQVTNLTNTIKKLKKEGYWVIGTAYEESSQIYTSIDYDMPIVLIIGSEGEGISNLVKKNCDYLTYLPMKGKVTSLNASVATGIMLYHILENRDEE